MTSYSSAAERVGASASFDRVSRRSSRGQLIAEQLGEATLAGPPTELRLDLISTNPENPRETLGEIDGLASSLAEIGLVQALTIASVEAYLEHRPEAEHRLDEGARYVVVDGHRRLAAARLAGFTTIKVMVNNDLAATDETLLEAAFVANTQREGLTELELAHALSRLVEFHGSQHETGRRIGKSQPYISQKLSLLELAPDLQADLQAGRRQVNQVRGLSKLSAEEQRQEADRRAEATRVKKEAAKQRKNQLVPAPAPAADNSVITDSAAVPQPQAPEAEGTGITAQPATDATTGDNSVITDQHDEPFLVDIRNFPRARWADGRAVADLAGQKMTPEEREVLLVCLFQMLPEERKEPILEQLLSPQDESGDH
ncbi:ParB/RepB/Spo0J family partition protein [Streptomyces sp. NPDC004667]|uniref:ParB/RepB/Spo0J family partition protein n=1 Tax=Streptomyces sp. NPDC004667 TaxID=3154285 RepID=UPI0033BB0E2E